MAHDHSSFLDDIPAYALSALDADEVAALEAHLQICESCRTELAAYRAVSDSLLTALPPQQPPAALRRRLQGRLPHNQKAARPRLTWSFDQVTLGLAITLLLAINVLSFFQIRSLQNQQIQLADQIQTSQIALAMLAYPGTRSLPINAQNIAGTLLLNKERNAAVLIAWNLPQLPENQTYQAWFIDAQGGRTSAAIFRPDPSLPFTSISIISPNNLSTFSGLGVTVEPSGGSAKPTGPRIFGIGF